MAECGGAEAEKYLGYSPFSIECGKLVLLLITYFVNYKAGEFIQGHPTHIQRQ